MPAREFSVQTCATWDTETQLQCGNGVSWIDQKTRKGYCEACAKQAPMALKKDLIHIWYGQPYLNI